MHKNRLEAFSDGVLAIIITVMVLQMKVPHGTDIDALEPAFPVFLSYVLSFIYIGIYWNNHHHLLHTVQRVTGSILWANLNLLFWLSLFPFATGWMGENHFSSLPSAIYGLALLMAAIAYYALQCAIMAAAGPDSILRRAIGLFFLAPWAAQALYAGVALLWLVPDKRIESVIAEDQA